METILQACGRKKYYGKGEAGVSVSPVIFIGFVFSQGFPALTENLNKNALAKLRIFYKVFKRRNFISLKY